MKKVFFVLSISLLVMACTKEKDGAVPECIQERLASFELNEACGQGASLERYTFQGNTVYVFNPGGCGADMVQEVRSEECGVLGLLGGISGNADINGVNFDQNATYLGRVWAN